MSKRVADTYLTDQNWDKEQPEEQVKGFFCIQRLVAEIVMILCVNYSVL